ncbi:MAG: hypothetical protein WCA89_04830 [Terracidiphilus sp.]
MQARDKVKLEEILAGSSFFLSLRIQLALEEFLSPSFQVPYGSFALLVLAHEHRAKAIRNMIFCEEVRQWIGT